MDEIWSQSGTPEMEKERKQQAFIITLGSYLVMSVLMSLLLLSWVAQKRLCIAGYLLHWVAELLMCLHKSYVLWLYLL